MKLSLLKALAPFFSSYDQIFCVRRIDDNLFRLSLDFDDFYFDMTKSKSTIFISEEKILGHSYQAPFDLALQKYCSRAKLLSCKVDGENRILIFEFLHFNPYKQERCFLHFEFTGRYTNVILLNEEKMILEALRHISSSQSIRVIKPQKPFIPLLQPKSDQACLPQSFKEIQGLKEELKKEYKKIQDQTMKQKQQALLKAKEKKLNSLKSMLLSLPNPNDLQKQISQYRLWGEAIFASLYKLSYFQKEIELEDFDGQKIKISFPDKICSFSEGGNYFFTQSKKAKQKLLHLWIQRENLETKIAFLQREMDYIAKIECKQELSVFLKKPNKIQKHPKNKDYESFYIDEFKISVGKNMKENQKLLEDAKADDLWLHIQNIPSSHMIIHCGKAKVRDEVLRECGKILLGLNGIWDKNIMVDYTQRRFVKIIEGANVFYAKHKTLVF